MSDERSEFVWDGGPLNGKRQVTTKGVAQKLFGQESKFRVPITLDWAHYRFDDAFTDGRLFLRFVDVAKRPK